MPPWTIPCGSLTGLAPAALRTSTGRRSTRRALQCAPGLHRAEHALGIRRADMNAPHQPLAGVRVIELGQLLAGPFAGTLLAYFGAEVIKVEPPGGDPIRGWRKLDDNGTSFWWRSLGRNKKSVTLDLKSKRGIELVKQLIEQADVV